MEGDDPYLDTAVYHCQQAVEKALKAFLTYHDTEFEKTHDLTELVEVCFTIAIPHFDAWRGVAAILTPYAVLFRYPADVLEPEQSEAEDALAYAQAFLEFVFGLLARRSETLITNGTSLRFTRFVPDYERIIVL